MVKVTMIMILTVTVTHLGLGLAAEPDGDDGQDGGGAQLGPGGGLLPLVSLDQPEGDPGGHHDDVQGDVHLQRENREVRHNLKVLVKASPCLKFVFCHCVP